MSTAAARRCFAIVFAFIWLEACVGPPPSDCQCRATAGSNAPTDGLQRFLDDKDTTAAAVLLFDMVDRVLPRSHSGLSLDRSDLVVEVGPRLVALNDLKLHYSKWSYEFSVDWIPTRKLPTEKFDNTACSSWITLATDPDRRGGYGSEGSDSELICGKGGMIADAWVEEGVALHRSSHGMVAMRYRLSINGLKPDDAPDDADILFERISHAIKTSRGYGSTPARQ